VPSLQAILHGTRNATVSISNVYVIELSQGCRTAVELLFKRILNAHRPAACAAADKPFPGHSLQTIEKLEAFVFHSRCLP
jgi:hypothetical protein